MDTRPILRTAVRAGPAPAPGELAPKLRVRNLSFYYGDYQALRNISLDIPEHRVTAFIGPSGCGQSTLLRTFNRMYSLYSEQRAEGEVMIDGENLLTRNRDVSLILSLIHISEPTDRQKSRM